MSYFISFLYTNLYTEDWKDFLLCYPYLFSSCIMPWMLHIKYVYVTDFNTRLNK
jgi:hypothetical protein